MISEVLCVADGIIIMPAHLFIVIFDDIQMYLRFLIYIDAEPCDRHRLSHQLPVSALRLAESIIALDHLAGRARAP